jgi:hypothetical protein
LLLNESEISKAKGERIKKETRKKNERINQTYLLQRFKEVYLNKEIEE